MKKQPARGIDYTSVLGSIEKYSPYMARTILMRSLNLVIPFNSHLKSKLKLWTDHKCIVGLHLHRAIKNHLGGVHAGALFTLSESAAGILLIRNFSPAQYRLIMERAEIEYFKQARNECEAVCEMTKEKLTKIKSDLKAGKPFQVTMKTNVHDMQGENLCTLKTHWQIKHWDQVRSKT